MYEWQTRLLGFFTEADLQTFSQATVFIPGCGAIGSTVLQVLTRNGVGRFIIADFDSYTKENIPGQIFCDHTVIDRPKIEVARERILQINPAAKVEIYGPEWMYERQLTDILKQIDVAILGVDSLAAGVLVHRESRKYSFPVVDFYYSPALSTYVTLSSDPKPEERFGYPTLGRDWKEADTYDLARESLLRLSAFVFSNCPWLIKDIAPDMLYDFLNLRQIPVLPSLVIMAGAVMAEETLCLLRGRKPSCDYRGWFFDWRKQRVVRARDPHDKGIDFAGALATLRKKQSLRILSH